MEVHPDMKIVIEEDELRVERPSDQKEHRALHGLTRSLIQNMVIGVTNGFSKTLEIIGVGYRADPKASGITLKLGYSHSIDYLPDDGITLECPNQTTIVVQGIDKQKVGQAQLRSVRSGLLSLTRERASVTRENMCDARPVRQLERAYD
ncbi:MAG: hypothetical protein Ct9H300mP15_26940 [Gemmatimonadota bacterium]|nr:MAG: hypothetical protein Ct9H300mP15_26940 [Gemmatimonadota bacterium]